MICKHRNTTCGRDRCFTGPVSRDENRAAHGNMTYTVTCDDCGAQQDVNQNQGFFERGPWGASRAERERERVDANRQLKHELERELKERFAAISPLRLTSNKGRTATVSVDQEGYVIARGAPWDAIAAAVVGSEWWQQATAIRMAIVYLRGLS